MTKAKNETINVGPIRVAPLSRNGTHWRWEIDLPAELSPTGKRQRLSRKTKTEAKAEAERLLREYQLDGAVQGYGPKLSGITFEDVSRKWIDEQTDRVATLAKRASSLESEGFKLKALLSHFRALDVAKVTSKEIVGYKKARTEQGRKAPTINGELALLMQVLGWAKKKKLIAELPEVEPMKVRRQRVELPTLAETVRILDHLPERLVLLIHFLAETGVRKAEALTLEWHDIRPDNGLVMIRDKAGFQTKNETSNRDVPIGADLMALFAAAKEKAQKKAAETGKPMPALVFASYKTGGRIWDVSKALATAVKAAGVLRDGKPIHLNFKHFRKSHISWQAERGTPESLLQLRVGHVPGSRVTQSVYTHVTTEAARGIILELPTRRAGTTQE